MKIIIEILDKVIDGKNEISYRVDESKTFIISLIKNITTIQEAKAKFLELKSTIKPSQKIRVLEYHNDESGIRQPCKVLYE